jgi:hypothetical protein
MDAHPLLVHKLEPDYVLDLISSLDLVGNDRERVHTLKILADERDFDLYYTIVTQTVISMHEDCSHLMSKDEQVRVRGFGLEMLLQLHDGYADNHVEGINAYRDGCSKPVLVRTSEFLPTSRHLQTSEKTWSTKFLRKICDDKTGLFQHV